DTGIENRHEPFVQYRKRRPLPARLSGRAADTLPDCRWWCGASPALPVACRSYPERPHVCCQGPSPRLRSCTSSTCRSVGGGLRRLAYGAGTRTLLLRLLDSCYEVESSGECGLNLCGSWGDRPQTRRLFGPGQYAPRYKGIRKLG